MCQPIYYQYKYCPNLQIKSRPAEKQSESSGSGSCALVEVTNRNSTNHILKCHEQVSYKNTMFQK